MLFVRRPNINKTPVTIIGAGPAGIMTKYGLIIMGWDESAITLIDKFDKPGGILTF